MQAFPHDYQVSAAAESSGDVTLTTEGVAPILSASPVEFDGPGGRWSPETLLVGAVADCFILTFRAFAKYSKLPWLSLTCEVNGVLDRLDRTTQFTTFHIRAVLRIPHGANEEHAERLLVRAEEACLITNSLKAPVHLNAEVEIVRPSAAEQELPALA